MMDPSMRSLSFGLAWVILNTEHVSHVLAMHFDASVIWRADVVRVAVQLT